MGVFCYLSRLNPRDIAAMGKRKRSVALIESDSDDDSQSGADIEAVNVSVVFSILLEIENETLSQCDCN